MSKRSSLGFLVLPVLAGCGSTDQRGMEEAVRDAIGDRPNLTVTEPVVFRDGDLRRSCVIATFENDWGERQAPQMVVGRFHFQSETWQVETRRIIEDGSAGEGACEAFAASRTPEAIAAAADVREAEATAGAAESGAAYEAADRVADERRASRTAESARRLEEMHSEFEQPSAAEEAQRRATEAEIEARQQREFTESQAAFEEIGRQP